MAVTQIGRTAALSGSKISFKIFPIQSRTGGADTAQSCAQNLANLAILERWSYFGEPLVWAKEYFKAY